MRKTLVFYKFNKFLQKLLFWKPLTINEISVHIIYMGDLNSGRGPTVVKVLPASKSLQLEGLNLYDYASAFHCVRYSDA